MANVMTAADLEPKGDRTLAALVLTQFSRNIIGSASEGLTIKE